MGYMKELEAAIQSGNVEEQIRIVREYYARLKERNRRNYEKNRAKRAAAATPAPAADK